MAVGIVAAKIDDGDGSKVRVPVGYKFAPTDVELSTIYLCNKVRETPIPGHAIPDLDATLFYRLSPFFLVELFEGEGRKRRWGDKDLYFFVRKQDIMDARRECKVSAGKGNGYWEYKHENRVYNSNGDVVALKAKWIYVDGNGKETHWSMEEFTLSNKISTNQWVLLKIRR